MSNGRVQHRYRLRIALFLLAVVPTVILLSTAYQGINTLHRLEVVESERDQWQRPSDILQTLNLREGSVAVDLGCGAGYFALKLSDRVGKQGKLFAVDIRPLPLLFLRIRAFLRNQSNLIVVHGSADNPRLPTGAVDAVLIANTFHEFANPEVIVRHTFQALRPGGRLVIVDRESEAQHHGLPPALVEAGLRQGGFEVMSRTDRFIDRPGNDPWWLIAARRP